MSAPTLVAITRLLVDGHDDHATRIIAALDPYELAYLATTACVNFATAVRMVCEDNELQIDQVLEAMGLWAAEATS
jgi:uncharacterized OsmC-like protein